MFWAYARYISYFSRWTPSQPILPSHYFYMWRTLITTWCLIKRCCMATNVVTLYVFTISSAARLQLFIQLCSIDCGYRFNYNLC